MRCIVSGPRDQDLASSSGACSSNSHSVCRREKAELDAEHERALSWNGGTAIYEDYCGSVARILHTVQSERLYSPVDFFFVHGSCSCVALRETRAARASGMGVGRRSPSGPMPTLPLVGLRPTPPSRPMQPSRGASIRPSIRRRCVVDSVNASPKPKSI